MNLLAPIIQIVKILTQNKIRFKKYERDTKINRCHLFNKNNILYCIIIVIYK